MRKPCWAWRSDLATDFYTRIELKSLQTTVIRLFLGIIRLNCSWAALISNFKELISNQGPPIQHQWETGKLLMTLPSPYICKRNIFSWTSSHAFPIRPTEPVFKSPINKTICWLLVNPFISVDYLFYWLLTDPQFFSPSPSLPPHAK